MKKLILISSVIAASFLGMETQAATLDTSCNGVYKKWNTNSVTYRASSVGFPVGNDYRTALGHVITQFNKNPSKIRFSMQYGDTSVGMNNGQNEVWWSSSISAPAVAYTWSSCTWFFGWSNNISESDIVFKNTVNYIPGVEYGIRARADNLIPYGGASRPFKTTALHEFGHGAGLGHENGRYSIMGQDWDHIHRNYVYALAYMGEDANYGLRQLYGNNAGNIQDVGLVHWKYSGASGAYSSHIRTKLYNTSGVELPYTTVNGERRYNVSKGQQVRMELTYENNGESGQAPTIYYYVSTNNFISTADTLIASTSFALQPEGSVYTSTRTVTIPSTLNSGQNYFLGGLLDPNNTIAEVEESNNATYIPIRVN
ncbi:hypothetical protein [Kangiella sp.]|uniref:hypothetical protein n=1 Tax=Kangiella sp. TaxID=1920245 RepID=UPI003A92FB75